MRCLHILSLCFRYHAAATLIVYAWVNDGETRRACASGDDAYRIFRKMPEGGQPADDWDRLVAEARAEARQLEKLVARTTTTQS